MPCTDDNLLVTFAHGGLSADQRAEVDEHLDGCVACRQVVVALAARMTGLVGSPGATPDSPASADDPQHFRTLLRAGASIDRYVVQEVLGAGGMGVVYAAYDPKLDREVALKLVRPEGSASASSELTERLLREAQVLARLSHPNVVVVYDSGLYEDQVYVAMERIHGQTLRGWLSQAHRSTAEILDIFVQAGRGLAAAHEAGIVHRDFKPDNVLVGKDGRPRVGDFGLAQRVAAPGGTRHPPTPPPAHHAHRTSGEQTLTHAGARLGTPAYMSPEQAQGSTNVDARSDQYAFFITLHEALHGARPGVTGEPSRPARRLPRYLRQVIARGILDAPEQRFPSMDAALTALEQGRRTRHRTVGAAAAVVAFCLVGGASAVIAREHDPCAGADRHIEAIWAQSRREALLQSFLSSGRPYAQPMFNAVATRLDDWTRRWTQAHRAACEATRVHEEQTEAVMTLRMSCLDQRLRELDAVQSVLQRKDPEIVDRALDALGALGDVQACANQTALTNQLALPADPERRARIAAVEAELNVVEALFRAGQIREGEPRAQAAAREADAVGFAPIVARGHWLLGMYLLRLGHEGPAEDALYRAAAEAVPAGADGIAARAWIAIVRLGATGHPSSAAPRRAESFARAFIGRVGAPELEGQLYGALGYVEARAARHDNAVPLLEKALAHQQAGRPEDVGALATAHMNLGNALSSLNRFDDAAAQYQKARDLNERVLGRDHPDVARVLFNIGISHARAGRFDRAEPPLREAVSVYERGLGPTAPQTGEALGMLANVLADLGRGDEALSLQLRALDALERSGGPENAKLATLLGNLAHALVGVGRAKEALPHARRAVDIKVRTLGPEHPSLSYPLTTLGAIHLDTGNPRDAVEVLERSLRLQEKTPGPPLTLGETRFRLAQALWAVGRRTQALALARAVLEQANTPEASELHAETTAWIRSVRGAR